MKRIIGIALFVSIFSIIAGCKSEQEQISSTIGADCLPFYRGFIETYRNCYDLENTFFVKGVTISHDGYKKKIKILEDVKGNFKGKPSITLWDHWEFGSENWKYTKNDILLILMGKEENGTYFTFGCGCSTLLLSKDGYATGVFNTDSKETIVPWNELQKLLSSASACQSEMDFVENYHTNVNREDVFFVKGDMVERCWYGAKIKIIKDLKGNFLNESPIVVWGKGDFSKCIDRVGGINFDPTFFNDKNPYTMYMLIKPIVSDDVPFSERKIGDFTTIECASSVVSINVVERKMGNGDFVLGMTAEEFEEKFGINLVK